MGSKSSRPKCPQGIEVDSNEKTIKVKNKINDEQWKKQMDKEMKESFKKINKLIEAKEQPCRKNSAILNQWRVSSKQSIEFFYLSPNSLSSSSNNKNRELSQKEDSLNIKDNNPQQSSNAILDFGRISSYNSSEEQDPSLIYASIISVEDEGKKKRSPASLMRYYQTLSSHFHESQKVFLRQNKDRLDSNNENGEKVRQMIKQMFSQEEKNSLAYLTHEWKLDSSNQIDVLQKSLIFYHSRVLEKYFLKTLVKRNANQIKSLRKNLEQIIEKDNVFLVMPMINRFNQILSEYNFRPIQINQSVSSNSNSSSGNQSKEDKQLQQKPKQNHHQCKEGDEQVNKERHSQQLPEQIIFEIQDMGENHNTTQKYTETLGWEMRRSISELEGDSIRFAFGLLCSSIGYLIDKLLKRTLPKCKSKIFGNNEDLYKEIFCGQISEKLIFNQHNRQLMFFIIQQQYETINKYIKSKIDLDITEDLELLLSQLQQQQQQQQLQCNQTFQDQGVGGLKRLSFFIEGYHHHPHHNNLHNNCHHSTSNSNLSEQKTAATFKQSQECNEDSHKHKNSSIKLKTSQVSPIKQRAQLSNIAEEYQSPFQGRIQKKGTDLDCIDEQFQSETVSEVRVFSKNSENLCQIKEEIQNESEFNHALKMNNNEQKIDSNNNNVQNQNNNQVTSSPKDKQILQNSLSQQSEEKNEKDTGQQRESNDLEEQFLFHEESKNSHFSYSPKLDCQKLSLGDQQYIMTKQPSVRFMEEEDNSLKSQSNNKDSSSNNTNSNNSSKEKGKSDEILNVLRVYLKDMLNYFEQIYEELDECLQEKKFYKKIKKGYKLMVNVQDKFSKNSYDLQASANYVTQKENLYEVTNILLKSYLKFKPHMRYELFQFALLIELIPEDIRSITYLEELCLFLRQILQVDEAVDLSQSFKFNYYSDILYRERLDNNDEEEGNKSDDEKL